jgi:hypothetical protein
LGAGGWFVKQLGKSEVFFCFFLAMTLLSREASAEREVDDPPVIEWTLMLPLIFNPTTHEKTMVTIGPYLPDI